MGFVTYVASKYKLNHKQYLWSYPDMEFIEYLWPKGKYSEL